MKATTPGAPPVAPPIATAFSAEDEKWMSVALEHGARGTPSPNPHVGAVLVKGGQGLSE